MDVLTGMAIMCIVITMAFYMSTSLNGQYSALQSNRLELNDLITLSGSMTCQVSTADEVHEIPNGFELIQKDRSPISYEKSGNQLIRKDDWSSMVVSESLKEMSFDYFESMQGENQEEISGIHLEMDFDGQKMNYHFFRAFNYGERINQLLVREF